MKKSFQESTSDRSKLSGTSTKDGGFRSILRRENNVPIVAAF